ncbi:hypothetical protein FHX52_4161 [Humibacillus xanthopallidus]|uniref:YCII-related domain-containing protein n=1 Tax=Humibacillus xanthopallidus TaxID=412689 RepID=A0A543PLI7_9MICO|nr:YciI family protein [Humibacillus xanthopallidus]TQN44937.1 hypothetical protein FHX52_4161 [Humibacillus xanthopallidus]
MRFMIIVPATARSEAGGLPTEAELAAMTDYNEELLRAGVLVGGEGLHPTSRGARFDFAPDGEVTITDGPFAESKELVAGFTLIDVSSRDEAVEWVKRWPRLGGEEGFGLELRQVFAAEDFGAELTPELQEREAQMRARTSATTPQA